MNDAIQVALIVTAGGLVTTGLSAFAAWFFGRRQVKSTEVTASAHVQEAINSGFAVLTEKYAQRETALTDKIDEQSKLIDQQSGLITNLIGTVRGLAQHVQSLESLLRGKGLDVPAAAFKYEEFLDELPGVYRIDRRRPG